MYEEITWAHPSLRQLDLEIHGAVNARQPSLSRSENETKQKEITWAHPSLRQLDLLEHGAVNARRRLAPSIRIGPEGIHDSASHVLSPGAHMTVHAPRSRLYENKVLVLV